MSSIIGRMLITLANQRSGTKYLGLLMTHTNLIKSFGEVFYTGDNLTPGFEISNFNYYVKNFQKLDEFLESGFNEIILDDFFKYLLEASEAQNKKFIHIDIMFNNIFGISPRWTFDKAPILKFLKDRKAGIILLTRDPVDVFASQKVLDFIGIPHLMYVKENNIIKESIKKIKVDPQEAINFAKWYVNMVDFIKECFTGYPDFCCVDFSELINHEGDFPPILREFLQTYYIKQSDNKLNLVLNQLPEEKIKSVKSPLKPQDVIENIDEIRVRVSKVIDQKQENKNHLLKNINYGNEYHRKDLVMRQLKFLTLFFNIEENEETIERIYEITKQFFMKKYKGFFGGPITFGDAIIISFFLEFYKPTKVIEIGCASGVSTSFFLWYAKNIGLIKENEPFLISIDLENSERMLAILKNYYSYLEKYLVPFLGHTSLDFLEKNLELPISNNDRILGFIDANHSHPWPLIDLLFFKKLVPNCKYVLMQGYQLMERFFQDSIIFNVPVPKETQGVNLVVTMFPGKKVVGTCLSYNMAALDLQSINTNEFRDFLDNTLKYPWETAIPKTDIYKVIDMVLKNKI